MVRQAAAEIEKSKPPSRDVPVSRDPAMLDILARIDTLSHRSSHAKVLLLGESGVGKELLARRIHQTSLRRDEPFVPVNCAAIADTLFEREFFGHKRGAFTGAVIDEPGYFELAHRGTLFLDELGDLPIDMQAKLLRVIEDGHVRRLGDSAVRIVNVRIIAATNKHLEDDVERGSFRLDLFHRLNSVEMYVPALRERRADIPALAEYLLATQCAEHDLPVPRMAPETLECLLDYHYPGNVRELRQALLSAVLQCSGDVVRPEHLPRRMVEGRQGLARDTNSRRSKQAAERERICWALEKMAGNQTRAAKLLGMPLRTFVSRLVRYGIPRPKQRIAHERRPRH